MSGVLPRDRQELAEQYLGRCLLPIGGQQAAEIAGMIQRPQQVGFGPRLRQLMLGARDVLAQHGRIGCGEAQEERFSVAGASFMFRSTVIGDAGQFAAAGSGQHGWSS